MQTARRLFSYAKEILLDLAEAITRSTESVDARAVELLNRGLLRSNPAAAALTVGDFADYNALIAALLKRNAELSSSEKVFARSTSCAWALNFPNKLWRNSTNYTC